MKTENKLARTHAVTALVRAESPFVRKMR